MYLEVIERSSVAICFPCTARSWQNTLPWHSLAMIALQALTLSISLLVCICTLCEILYEMQGPGVVVVVVVLGDGGARKCKHMH